MNKMIRRSMALIFAGTFFMYTLTGCSAEIKPGPADAEEEDFYEEDMEDIGEEDIEEYEEDEEAGAEEAGIDEKKIDEIVELAKKHSGAPLAELDQVLDNGYLSIHLYEDMGDHVSTWDWYEIDPETLEGTNFMGEKVDLNDAGVSGAKSAEAEISEEEGDEGEGVDIADGEYVTDDEYEGELSSDGKTMTITTALYEYVNSPSPSYEKRTYVFDVADSAKCIEIHEEEKETSFFDSMDLISEFLKGKSGLPITLTIKDNQLVAIMFTS